MVGDVEVKCVKRNDLGECIEYREIGDRIVLVFKESEKKCNPEKYVKWKAFVNSKKISVLPED